MAEQLALHAGRLRCRHRRGVLPLQPELSWRERRTHRHAITVDQVGVGASRSAWLAPDRSDRSKQKESNMLGTVLIVVLVLALVGALPRWPHSREWGYYPTGGLGLAIFVIVILLVLGRI